MTTNGCNRKIKTLCSAEWHFRRLICEFTVEWYSHEIDALDRSVVFRIESNRPFHIQPKVQKCHVWRRAWWWWDRNTTWNCGFKVDGYIRDVHIGIRLSITIHCSKVTVTDSTDKYK